MKLTLSWLKDHLDTNATLTEIMDRLVSLGLEVEGIENTGEKLKGFVVGQVVEREKHPNADRLNLCQVDAGTGELIQVVCGATNVRQGMKVVFAPLGTVIPITGQTLQKGVIRDVESFGMMCSSRELELGDDHDGIIDLETDALPGTPFVDVMNLNGPVIELSITPNRSDCFGIRGIARDLAASDLGTLKPLSYSPTIGTFHSPITVAIQDSKACPDFRGVFIKNVQNTMSPPWVQQRLKAIGLRPINALVDVTNYINMDLCRPLHVFDADKLKGSLIVRSAKSGESLDALNEKTYDLQEGMTVICDDSGVLSLAGIMGGLSTGCSESTTNVFVECAAFDPINIANTGRTLQILSDSRTRFERGIDPESLDFGMDAAIQLILNWCGGEASHVVVATHTQGQPEKQQARRIILTQQKLTSLSGTEIPLPQAQSYLEKLGFTVTQQDSALAAIVPSHRPDVEGPADLVEEILRLIGYDNIPAVPLPQVTPVPVTKTRMDIARQTLASRGFLETITWSFMGEEKATLFGWSNPALKLNNPISIDLSIMRPSILPNLIDGAVRNSNRGLEGTALFEVGPCFNATALPASILPQEALVACGLRAGKSGPRHWETSQRDVDVFDVKADVCAILLAHGLTESSYQVDAQAPSYYHPGRSGSLKQGKRILATFGEIHPRIAQSFDANQPLVGFEVFLDHLPLPKTKKAPLSLSPYQTVTRDFAFVVDRSVSADQIIKSIQKVDKTLITQVTIFDVYTGDKIDHNKKSIAVEIRLEPTSGTLTDAEIQLLSTKIMSQVEKTTGAQLRQ